MSNQLYTISKTATGYMLTEVNNYAQIFIDIDHAKYDWVGKNLGRVVNISEQGRWNSSKDYYNYYGTSKAKSTGTQATETKKPLQVSLQKLDDLNINPDLFQPMLTGTVLDKFLSQEGGFLPGSNIMAAGAPGVGKTTVLLEMLSHLHEQGKQVLFISAEMNQVDMARYLKRFPNWGQLPILFLADYTDENPQQVIEQVLSQGWDLVLTDSYTEVNDTVKEECNISRGKAEKWFLDLMTSHNKGQNQRGCYTTFLTILQLSKGGTFVGSNKLKHMTTAMMHLDWDGHENTGKRYMEFSKNRLGQVGKRLYYELGNGVQFDEAKYARDLFADQLLEDEKRKIQEEANTFDLFFSQKEDPEFQPVEL